METALLQSAWEELIAVGYADFTLDGVAARAGTSRPVLARHWPTSRALILAAVAHHGQRFPIQTPDTGTLRGDVLALLRDIAGRANEIAGVVGFLLADRYRTDSDHRLEQRRFVTGVPEAMHAIVERAEARGEIDSRSLSPRMLSLPVDLVRHHVITAQGPLTDATLVEIVDDFFLPLAAHHQRSSVGTTHPDQRTPAHPLP